MYCLGSEEFDPPRYLWSRSSCLLRDGTIQYIRIGSFVADPVVCWEKKTIQYISSYSILFSKTPRTRYEDKLVDKCSQDIQLVIYLLT